MAIIDPGTNCAVRFSSFVTAETAGVRRVTEWRHKSQIFFAGQTSGKNWQERMAMLTRFLSESALFKLCDVYVIEAQHENNVLITLGCIVGIITTMRQNEVVVRTKRSGNDAVETMPYVIATMKASIKSAVIKNVLGITLRSKKPLADIKDLGIQVAKKIATDMGDEATLEMLVDDAKIDDIADTVCYERGFYMILE